MTSILALSKAVGFGSKRKLRSAAIVILCFALSVATSGLAHAAIIWDQSPAAIGGTGFSSLSNRSAAQNFSDPVRFESDHTMSGMDIYADTNFVNTGDPLVVRIRAVDLEAAPLEFVVTINIKDLDGVGSAPAFATRVHVDFSLPVLLLGSTTYFVGMSGLGFDEVGQLIVSGGTGPLLDNIAHTYNGLVHGVDSAPGDTAFRLHGAAVPEPSSFALLGIAFGALALRRRRIR